MKFTKIVLALLATSSIYAIEPSLLLGGSTHLHQGAVLDLANEGNLLVSGGADRIANISKINYELSTLSKQKEILGKSGSIAQVGLISNHVMIRDSDKNIIFWNMAESRQEFKLQDKDVVEAHAGKSSFDFIKNDGSVITLQEKNLDRNVFNLVAYGYYQTIHSGQLFWRVDYNALVTYNDKTLKEVKRYNGQKGTINSIICNDSIIITPSSDSTIGLWDEESGYITALEGHTRVVGDIVTKGDYLVSLSKPEVATDSNGNVTDSTELIIWQLRRDGILIGQIMSKFNLNVNANAVEFDPENNVIFVGTTTGDVLTYHYTFGTKTPTEDKAIVAQPIAPVIAPIVEEIKVVPAVVPVVEVQKVVEVIVPPVVITVIQEKEPLPVKVPVITSETFQSYKDHTNEAFEVFKK